jgi:hypothetical protein
MQDVDNITCITLVLARTRTRGKVGLLTLVHDHKQYVTFDLSPPLMLLLLYRMIWL